MTATQALTVEQSIQAARDAGPHYVGDGSPGIRRLRHGRRFVYATADGKLVRDDFTAKDFRTWIGTVCAAAALCGLGACATQSQRKKGLVEAVKQTAERLGNRPATCKKFYIHPAVIESHLCGELLDAMGPASDGSIEGVTNGSGRGLSRSEKAVLSILEKAARAQRGSARRRAG